MTAPNQTASIGRARTGRFAKGNPGGPGRPRGIDFRAAVAAKAEAEGISVEDAIWQVFQSLLAQAHRGDVQAAKLLLDRLCGKDTVEVKVEPQAPPMTDIERAARVNAILASAVRRAEEAAAATAEKRAIGATAHQCAIEHDPGQARPHLRQSVSTRQTANEGS